MVRLGKVQGAASERVTDIHRRLNCGERDCKSAIRQSLASPEDVPALILHVPYSRRYIGLSPQISGKKVNWNVG